MKTKIIVGILVLVALVSVVSGAGYYYITQTTLATFEGQVKALEIETEEIIIDFGDLCPGEDFEIGPYSVTVQTNLENIDSTIYIQNMNYNAFRELKLVGQVTNNSGEIQVIDRDLLSNTPVLAENIGGDSIFKFSITGITNYTKETQSLDDMKMMIVFVNSKPEN